MRAGDLCLSQPGCGLCAARQRDHDLRGWMPYAGPVTRQRYLVLPPITGGKQMAEMADKPVTHIDPAFEPDPGPLHILHRGGKEPEPEPEAGS